MGKKNYEAPTAQVTIFETTDVILASNELPIEPFNELPIEPLR